MGPWLIPILAAAGGALTSWGLNKIDKSGAPGAGTPEKYGKVRVGTPEASKFQKELFKSGGGLSENPNFQRSESLLKDLLKTGGLSENPNYQRSENLYKDLLKTGGFSENPNYQRGESLLKDLMKTGGLEEDKTFRKGSNYLQELLSGSNGAFERFEEPYMRNFNENILPDIANRFAGMGTGASGLSSSGFEQTLAQAGKGLQGDLASLRSQLQMQALPQAYQYAQGPVGNQLQAASQNLQYGQQPINNQLQAASQNLQNSQQPINNQLQAILQSLAQAQQPITNQLSAMQWSPYQTTHQARQPGVYDSAAQIAPGLLQQALEGLAKNWNSGGGQNKLNDFQNAILTAR